MLPSPHAVAASMAQYSMVWIHFLYTLAVMVNLRMNIFYLGKSFNGACFIQTNFAVQIDNKYVKCNFSMFVCLFHFFFVQKLFSLHFLCHKLMDALDIVDVRPSLVSQILYFVSVSSLHKRFLLIFFAFASQLRKTQFQLHRFICYFIF